MPSFLAMVLRVRKVEVTVALALSFPAVVSSGIRAVSNHPRRCHQQSSGGTRTIAHSILIAA